MIEDIRDAPAGPLVARQGVFSPAELDAIEAYGESLAPRKAEIAGRGDNTEHLRISRATWIDRNPETEWLYARLEQTVLHRVMPVTSGIRKSLVVWVGGPVFR